MSEQYVPFTKNIIFIVLYYLITKKHIKKKEKKQHILMV